MRTLKIAALFLAALGPAIPASAELQGKSEVSVQAGAIVFEGDSNIDTGLIYGARVGHFFTERLSAEVSLFTGATETGGGTDVTALHPELAAAYHFRFGKFMPFVQAGAGLLRVKPEGASASNGLALHWGGGLKYFYRENVLLRGDLAHVIDTEIGKGTHDLQAVLGVSWLFGMPGEVSEAASKADDEARRASDAARSVADEARRKAEGEARRLR